jgi:hypothetical protein
MIFSPEYSSHEARHFCRGQRQKALACGGGATKGFVNRSSLGPFAAGGAALLQHCI